MIRRPPISPLFPSPPLFRSFSRPAGVPPARLSNPLSEEAGVLKSTGIVTMAAALEWNLNHGQRDARLFEIGRHYRLKENRPVETSVLTIGATGEAREKSLYESPRDYSFADLKGALDEIGQLADGRDAQGFQWRDEGPEWQNSTGQRRTWHGGPAHAPYR